MLGIKSEHKPITGEYAKKLDEIIDGGNKMKTNKFTFSLAPMETIHTSNNKTYTPEQMAEMVNMYCYFSRLNGNPSVVGLGQIFNNRTNYNNVLMNASHKITKLSADEMGVDGEFECVLTEQYKRNGTAFTNGDKLHYYLSNHKAHNVIFVIRENIDGDDEIVSIDIELENY